MGEIMTEQKSITTITTASRTFKWVPYTPSLGPSSQRLYVNTMWIGWARPAFTQKGGKQQYEWSCMLPGLRANAAGGKAATIDAAQEACLKITRYWFEQTDNRT